MSSLNLNNEATSPNPWRIDSSGLWSLRLISTPVYISQQERGIAIAAQLGTDSLPFAQWSFDPPLVLQEWGSSEASFRPFEELRFWLRSDREADGSAAKPFYLTFEASGDSSEPPWQRFIPIQQKNVWELHHFWLGDMSESLRRSVRILALRSLDAGISFNASLGDLTATIPEPLRDVDTALLRRLDRRFQVSVDGVMTLVRVLIELPENPGDRTLPYILITPWSVQPQQERSGSGDLIDNYTFEGSYVRPPTKTVQLDYAIDIFAQNREQKVSLLNNILSHFSRQPFLIVNGEPLDFLPFAPSSEELAQFANPRRTPLFYRLVAQIETGDRQLRQRAVPFVLVNSQTSSTSRDRSNPELASI